MSEEKQRSRGCCGALDSYPGSRKFVLAYGIMSTTVDAIYERGIFKPVSGVPATLKEHDRVRITIESDDDAALSAEFAEWERASGEDLLAFEKKMEEIR